MIHDSQRLLITYAFNDVLIGYLRYGKTANKKRKIFATWLQKELNSDVARFTTYENNLTTLFLAKQGRTWVLKRATSLLNLVCSNVAKQVARFFIARFTAALVLFCIFSLVFKLLFLFRIM